MQARGTLFPNDRQYLEEARQQARAEGQGGQPP
jgi:hypothetical protein